MINTNLILIEGIIGSGKSTTAQILSMHLQKNGHNAKWYFEHEMPHPIYKYDEIQKALEGAIARPNSIFEKALSNWIDLANSLKDTNEIIILESTLFQTTAGTMLMLDLTRKEIINYVLKIQEFIKGLNPILINFYQEDVSKALRSVLDKRGADFEEYLIGMMAKTPYGRKNNIKNFDGVVGLFTVYREITDYLFSELKIRKLSIENSNGDWKNFYKQMSGFMSTTMIEYPFTPVDNLSDFVGRYKYDKDELTVVTDGKRLFLGNIDGIPLIYKEDNVFIFEGMCMEFEFVKGNNGEADKMYSSGNLPDSNDRTWVKV